MLDLQVEEGDLPTLVAAANLDPKGGDLSDVDLSGLDLSDQNLSGWDLRNANFDRANISGTRFEKAIVSPAQIRQAKDWYNAYLGEDLHLATVSLHKLMQSIVDLGLQLDIEHNLVVAFNVFDIGSVALLKEREVLKRLGRRALVEIRSSLQKAGLRLGMQFAWPAPTRFTIEAVRPAVPPKQSIGPGYLICLEDGVRVPYLREHLAVLGLSTIEYRNRWALPKRYPAKAPSRYQYEQKFDLVEYYRIAADYMDNLRMQMYAKDRDISEDSYKKIVNAAREAKDMMESVKGILNWWIFPSENKSKEINRKIHKSINLFETALSEDSFFSRF